MDKKKWTMNQITLMIGIPIGLVFLYIAFTSKPATNNPVPKIVEFRIAGQKENKSEGKWGVDLVWITQNADTVTIEPLVGKVAESGNTTVEMTKSGTFLLRAENPKGKAEYSLEIELPTK
jgi:hypothetical protein